MKYVFNQTLFSNPVIIMTMKSSKLFIIAVLAVIAISVTVVSVFSEAEAQEVTSPLSENTISVTGTATTKTEPDLLHIQFGVEIQEKTAKEALEANSQLMNSIVEAIKKVGIEDSEISTSSLNIYPIYDQYEDPLTKKYTQELIGYRVSNILSVETKKLDLAASIIDNAVGAGVNRVDNVYFTLSPDTHLKIKDELLVDATSNAKLKAEKALLPLDHSIIGVKTVSLSEFSMQYPTPVFRAQAVMYEESFALKAQTPIFTSDQDVSATASVVFIIGSK